MVFIEIHQLCSFWRAPLARRWRVAASVLDGSGVALEVVLFDREGALVGRADLAEIGHSRNRLR